MSFASHQHLQRLWLRLNIIKCRLLQIPDCALYLSIKRASYDWVSYGYESGKVHLMK